MEKFEIDPKLHVNNSEDVNLIHQSCMQLEYRINEPNVDQNVIA